MNKNKKVTVGYRYYAGMHLALCCGPVDAVTKIQVGDKVAWTGEQTASGTLYINQPALFGDKKREGGIVGYVDVAMGDGAQTANDYLTTQLGTPLPAYRGVTALVLRCVQLSCNNPYVKPWAVEARDIPSSWYPAKANINGDANPAHIIHEVLTNRSDDWGAGLNASELNEATFTAAADTLFAEGFGLSLVWDDQSSADDFIDRILDHVDGVRRMNLSTGQIEIKLLRDDYGPATGLLLLDPSNVLSVESFSRVGWGERANVVTVNFHSRDTDQVEPVTLSDSAAIEVQGGAIKRSFDFPGIANSALAGKVAGRELKKATAPLAKVSLVANRTAARLGKGDVFRWNWPEYGIADMVLRVVQVDYGKLQDGRVRLDCIQDVFSVATAVYGTPPGTGWTNPGHEPVDMLYRRVDEAPFWTCIKEIVGESTTALNELAANPDAGYPLFSGVAPVSDASAFDVWTRQGTAAYADTGVVGNPCPTGTLSSAAGPLDTAVSLAGAADLQWVKTGTYAYLENECVGISAVNPVTGQVTLQRGVLDTVPVPHAAGARLWFVESFHGVETQDYLSGEVLNGKLLTTTARGTLAVAAATENSLTFAHRYIRPYPPGNLKLNGAAYPATIVGELTVTWSHRDRLLQTALLIDTTAGDIGPEPGTTYTLRLYDETNTLRRTTTGQTGTSYTWTTEIADCGLGRLNNSLRIELEAVRDGYTSWTMHDVSVAR